MSDELEEALRYRNRAGALRAIAAEDRNPVTRDKLISVAEHYEQLAGTMEAIDKVSKNLVGKPSPK